MAMEKSGCGSLSSSRVASDRHPSETLSRFEGNVGLGLETYEKLFERENIAMRPKQPDGDEQSSRLAGTVEKAGERNVLCYPSFISPQVVEAEPLRTLQASTVGPGAGKDEKKRKLVIKIRGPAPKKPKLQQEAGPKPLEPKDMPQELKEHIEGKLRGTEIFLVCEKTLTATDVSPHHKRFFIPKSRISSLAFLREDERARLEVSSDEKDDHKSGLRVMVMDPSLSLRMPIFKKWESKKNCGKAVYVLTTAVWTDIVEANKLKEGDEVKIWSFRVLDLLSMALVIVKRTPSRAPINIVERDQA